MTNESTIHVRNLKFFITEVYKIINGLSPPIMNEVFQTNDCPLQFKKSKNKHKSKSNKSIIKSI